jgi:hypothetical protein
VTGRIAGRRRHNNTTPMRTRLSSRWTLFYRVVFPIAWIGVFGGATFGTWLGTFPTQPGTPEGMKYLFSTVWVLGSTFILWFTRGLRVVVLEGDTLLVRDLTEEERIPLQSVWSVTESRFINPKRIYLHLELGAASTERVVFLAPSGFQLPFTEHRMVKQLREAIYRSRTAAGVAGR